MAGPSEKRGRGKKVASSGTTFHIISMDGGGIYGLATADLLKQLCLGDESFLQKEDLKNYLFAGTSAGALNALLLAKQEDPREFLLQGGLDAFWRTSKVFDPPTDFWTWYWSFHGLTPWFGSKAYKESLRAIFGVDTNIDSLPQNVFVCVFDSFGFDSPRDAGGESWGPRFYSNFFRAPVAQQGDADEIGRSSVAHLAYAAAAPAGYRAFVHGRGDGGAALPTPELYSVLGIGRDARDFARRDPRIAKRLEELDPRVSLLSVGVCSTPWYYQLNPLCNFGYNAFWSWFPTNPSRGNNYPPTYDFNVSAPTSTSNQMSRDLLSDAYFRLNPGLFGPPTATPPELIAMLWARNPALRDWMIGEIQKGVKTREAQEAVSAALTYLASPGWKIGIDIKVGTDSIV